MKSVKRHVISVVVVCLAVIGLVAMAVILLRWRRNRTSVSHHDMQRQRGATPFSGGLGNSELAAEFGT
jgi:membrane protein YdbS with pleckstrin-like domain